MCIYEDCVGAEKSFRSRGEWIAHQVSHKKIDHESESSADTCPFCLKEFTSDQRKFYTHVGHHMEDIRLFALPPSYRQSDDLEAFDNSLGTEDSGKTQYDRRGELSIITEEASPQTAAASVFHEKLKAYNIPDKDRFVGNWLSISRGLAVVSEVEDPSSVTQV